MELNCGELDDCDGLLTTPIFRAEGELELLLLEIADPIEDLVTFAAEG